VFGSGVCERDSSSRRCAGMTLGELHRRTAELLATGLNESLPVVVFSEDNQVHESVVSLTFHAKIREDRHGNVTRPIAVEVNY
jgi:hypothetical protein